MFQVEDCIALLTNNGSKSICEAMNRQFMKNDITRLQWTALYFIQKNNRVTQKDLAAMLMISTPSATNLVHRLVRAGYIIQEDDPDDFRSNLLRLTAQGEKVYKDSYPIVESFNSNATTGISDHDLTIFKNVLNTMIANIQTEEDKKRDKESCSGQ